MKYCQSIYRTKRRKTREVLVGSIGVGGDNPIRIQSMTTSDTRNVPETIEQIIRMADAGCDIARVTVQGIKEAHACEAIKSGLIKEGYTIPLVADIHFYPPAAMLVADFVDKVRINPGNFVDRRATFRILEYDDHTYAEELQKIADKFCPLIEKCKTNGCAIRIGTNHGSLSDRIMNRYGDTPQGMVESALEFTRVARQLDFHDLIFSMKASNPQVMVMAYRLLAAKMYELDWDYPFHLGVTEAGEGEDGRIKSAAGTGSLLLDGLGDTIRVSLTEDPWEEIAPCRQLVALAEAAEGKGIEPFTEVGRDFLTIIPREVTPTHFIHRDGTVVLTVNDEHLSDDTFYTSIGCDTQLGRPIPTPHTTDALIYAGSQTTLPEKLVKLQEAGVTILSKGTFPNTTLILSWPLEAPPDEPYVLAVDDQSSWEGIEALIPMAILYAPQDSPIHSSRAFISFLKEIQCDTPVLFHFAYNQDPILQAGAEVGSLLCDRLGEGIAISAPIPLANLHTLSFSLLQACRMRASKTEFISCPGCGRTLFDLQQVAERIRDKTSHLPGVKIAIMGCIVNGPGEMADADFGYVGSKPGEIDLYVGKTCVERGIPHQEAVERLITLIKAHNRWVEPADLALT